MSTINPYHWFVSGEVVTRDLKGVERRSSMNAIVLTERAVFTRKDLAKAQHAMMTRFTSVAEQVKGAKIIDCFIISISNLGAMSQEEFHGDLAEPEAGGLTNQELN